MSCDTVMNRDTVHKAKEVYPGWGGTSQTSPYKKKRI